jgi:hypothetical protein
MIHREIRIYMPNIVDTKDVEALKDNKPFFMKAGVPVGSLFLSVVSIPSLIDMMGFSGGGGPPGYAFAVTNAQADETHLFFSVYPNTGIPELDLPPEEKITLKPLGVAQAVGILFGHYSATGPGVRSGEAERQIVEAGGRVIDMVPYEPPPMLKSLYDPKMQEALSKSVQDALKDAQQKATGDE